MDYTISYMDTPVCELAGANTVQQECYLHSDKSDSKNSSPIKSILIV